MFLERRVTGMNTVRCVTLALVMPCNTHAAKEDQRELDKENASLFLLNIEGSYTDSTLCTVKEFYYVNLYKYI
jgi:hypothetical protein